MRTPTVSQQRSTAQRTHIPGDSSNCSSNNNNYNYNGSEQCDTYNKKYAYKRRARQREQKGSVCTSPHFRQHCEASFGFKFNLPACNFGIHQIHTYVSTRYICTYIHTYTIHGCTASSAKQLTAFIL